MPNAGDYWAERGLANAVRVYNYSQRKARLITRWFNRASKDMQRKIDGFYRDYAEGEGISPQAAKETLTNRRPLSLTLADAAKLAKRAPKDATLAKLLRQNYLQRAISREEFLKLQLQVLASELYSDTDAGINRALTETFEDCYYHGLFDFQQFTGFGSGFNRISTHQIEAAVTTGWQGKNYSERLWGEHRVSLARYLNRIISTGIIEGRSNADMRAQLQKVMNMSAYNARRLIRTEATQISSRACAAAYGENGTPKFEFLATLDFKTSTICRDMDGRVFNTKDAKVGVNMPPLHPFCRSTTVPYIPDAQFDEGATRAARGGDGGTYKVPADMTYKDWYKKYVESNPAELLAEQKQRNGRDDAKQFAEYKARLGASAPKAFDDFQTIKYTDGEGWDALKSQYRTAGSAQRRELMQAPLSKGGGDGTGFDLAAAKQNFLQEIEVVPERQRRVLDYYSQEIEIAEDPRLPAPLAYHPTQERILYNTGHPDFAKEDFPTHLMHELAHAIDSINLQSWQNQDFSAAVSDAQKAVSQALAQFERKASESSCSDYFSDILSALGKGQFYTFAGHDPAYWQRTGNAEKEIFANLFCMQATKRVEEIAYLNEAFPYMIQTYQKLLERMP